MPIVLNILAFVVVLAVVISASYAVRKALPANAPSLILFLCVTAALLILALVALVGTSGLTDRSAFHQGALIIFLVAIAVTCRLFWASKRIE
jgi:hypothetical protein